MQAGSSVRETGSTMLESDSTTTTSESENTLGPNTPTSADQASNSFEATYPDTSNEHTVKDRVEAATPTAEPLVLRRSQRQRNTPNYYYLFKERGE